MAMVVLFLDGEQIGTGKKIAAPKRSALKSWFSVAKKAYPKELAEQGIYPEMKTSKVDPDTIRFGSVCGRVGFLIDRTAPSL